MKGSPYDQVYFVTENRFKIIGEVDKLPPDRPVEFYNNIDIAGRGCFSPAVWFRAIGSTWIQEMIFPDVGHIVGLASLFILREAVVRGVYVLVVRFLYEFVDIHPMHKRSNSPINNKNRIVSFIFL